MFKRFFLCLLFLTTAGGTLLSAVAEASDQFCENGLFVNKVQLERAKLRLADPKWRDQSNAFLTRVKGYTNVHPSPYKGGSSSKFIDAGRKEIMMAIDLALYATISSDQDRLAAADISKEVLLAWAHDSVFAGQFSMGEPKDAKEKQDFAGLGLYVGLIGIGAAHTYHLLKCNGSLSDDDTRVIVDWLGRISEAVLEGQKRWKTHHYFGQPIGNNHISFQNAALYGIALATSNAKLRDWVLQDPDNQTSFHQMLSLAIYDGRERVEMKPDDVGAIPNRGEITDRYRMTEAKKGLNYSFFHLLALTLIAEAAANQGVDLYKLKGANGESLVDPLLYYGELLASSSCSTQAAPIISRESKGYEYYSGAKIQQYFWPWLDPLFNRLGDRKEVVALAARVRKTSCKVSSPQLAIPFTELINAGD